ncbi:sulfatase (plasmid) [Fulvitalea axinellae]|uniref:Sulfatase n=1 Tax=Fulvitalea axinellae TaxID=1182444 RepID=A0AAU9CTN2_9BACT|nr:sulfatase [Fulvitalea axinellae]
MKRRNFIKNSALAAAGVSCLPKLAHSARRKKPNVLIIHTDQQSTWTLGAYGGKVVPTPYIDSLAEEGARLDNFFTNSAVCTASRGCFISGMYPHTNGAYKNDEPLRQDIETFAHVFKKNGYETGYVGKWHLDGEPKPGFVPKERSVGFDDCKYMMNRGHWKKMEDKADGSVKVYPYKVIGDKKTYTTDFVTEKTLDFIKKDRGDKPFMMMLSIPDPHGPLSVREPYASMYKPKDMELPRTFNAPPPHWIDKSHRYGKDQKNRVKRLKYEKAQYYGMVKCIDDNVGKIIRTLKAKGIYDNTILVFTADHGEYMGEHGGLYGKNMFYETAYRVPFLVRWPKGVKPGTVIKQHVTTVDFKATIAGLAGLNTNGNEQGLDASRMLEGRKASRKMENRAYFHHSHEAFAGAYDDDFSVGFFPDGNHLLFDRKSDPDQINNLAKHPKYAGTLQDLYGKVLANSQKMNQPSVKWLTKLDLNKASRG